MQSTSNPMKKQSAMVARTPLNVPVSPRTVFPRFPWTVWFRKRFQTKIQNVHFNRFLAGFFLGPVLLLQTTSQSQAQLALDRYQLGRRLERFEKTWEQATEPKRTSSTPAMERAVTSFFSLQLAQAGQSLDQAWMDSLGIPPDEQTKWMQSNRWLLDWERPWIAPTADSNNPTSNRLRGQLREFYAAPAAENSEQTDALSNQKWLLKIYRWKQNSNEDAQVAAYQTTLPSPISTGDPKSSEASVEIPLQDLAPGDYRVRISIEGQKDQPEILCEAFSVIDRIDSRMQSVEQWLESNGKISTSKKSTDRQSNNHLSTATEISTARFLAKELLKGRKGTPTEIDFPWHQLLSDFEQITAPNKQDSPRGIQEWAMSPGTKWIQLSREKDSQVARIEVPECDAIANPQANKRIPVLIALHGAGGSENMFFETYGAGRLVSLAKTRGWLVVSPRQTMSGLGMDISTMIDSLAELWPIDRDQILLCGHSMGAAQALAQVSRSPKTFRAVAALGGGGSVRSSDAIKDVPFFVAAGERDFGKPRAKTLASQLQGLNCSVEYREYPNVEHMVIVQAALNDVFVFFDKFAGSTVSDSH